ncbi:hypothetical protein Pan2_86 [Pseudanabaena phage Pan2]|nr:hypothetical protein Pan2_86 [Pseudanabaena phage Pan2]
MSIENYSQRFFERLAEIDTVALCGPIVLPNGRAGIITGWNRNFALFVDGETGMEEEYAWQTVQRFRASKS